MNIEVKELSKNSFCVNGMKVLAKTYESAIQKYLDISQAGSKAIFN